MNIQMTTTSWQDYLVEMDRWAVLLNQPNYKPTPAQKVMILTLAQAVQTIPPYASQTGDSFDPIAFNHDLGLLYEVDIEAGVTVRDIIEQTTGRRLSHIERKKKVLLSGEQYYPVFWYNLEEENEDEDY